MFAGDRTGLSNYAPSPLPLCTFLRLLLSDRPPREGRVLSRMQPCPRALKLGWSPLAEAKGRK